MNIGPLLAIALLTLVVMFLWYTRNQNVNVTIVVSHHYL
jgi:hypothetical protein